MSDWHCNSAYTERAGIDFSIIIGTAYTYYHNSMDASQPAAGDNNTRHEHRRSMLIVTPEATIETV